MPSPGYTAILNAFDGLTYSVEGGYNTSFNKNNSFIQDLASAIHNGWTSATPTTSTTMASKFAAQPFASYTGYSIFIQKIAQGIDAEVNAWVASWVPPPGSATHTYVVNQASIYNRIMSASSVQSNGAKALAQKCAQIFASNFGQEVG